MKLDWKQTLAVFVLGCTVGMVGTYWCGPLSSHSHGRHGHSPERLLEKFNSKLSLTQDQRTQVAAILEAKHQKIQLLRGEFRPKFEEIRAAATAEIRQVLTPEQQQKFDVMDAKWKAKAKQCHGMEKEGGR